MRALPLVLLVLFAAAPQQAPPPPPPPPAVAPPRDTRPPRDATGTASIRGHVVAADTGLPIRRATVRLSPMTEIGSTVNGRPVVGRVEGTDGRSAVLVQGRGGAQNVTVRPRSTTTDDQGAFEFKELPAGSYRVLVSAPQYAAQYLPSAYGSRSAARDVGRPIQLVEGQTFDKATIALPRGGVIVGRVTDDGGEPMARVQVFGLWYAPGSRRGQRNSGGVQTDDLGQFRLYGLAPGEYAVVADSRASTFVPPNMQSEANADQDGLLTTFYPGTADETTAQHVRVRAGTETPGIEIRMLRGRLFRVSGIVIDSQGNPMARVNGQLLRRSTTTGMFGGGFSTDEQGRFQMQNLAPGNYRLMVRQRQVSFGPNGPEGDPGESANVPLTIAGADIENLTIVTAPAVIVKGHVEFEGAAPESPHTMHIMAIPGEQDMPTFGPRPRASVQQDLTFTLRGMNDEYLIRSDGLSSEYYLKAVLVGGQDVLDTPRAFKPQDHLTIVLSSRAATLEGAVTDTAGAPTSEAGIIVFPDDQASWRASASRVKRASPDAQGRYRITGLAPGRYFAIATPRERLNTYPGMDYAAFYDELSKEATALVINEEETRTVDLRVAAPAGGQ